MNILVYRNFVYEPKPKNSMVPLKGYIQSLRVLVEFSPRLAAGEYAEVHEAVATYRDGHIEIIEFWGRYKVFESHEGFFITHSATPQYKAHRIYLEEVSE